tara:strand:+ start:49713 stop:50291 length:579 start_codon:yes stop_codon:yes gene_type:complete
MYDHEVCVRIDKMKIRLLDLSTSEEKEYDWDIEQAWLDQVFKEEDETGEPMFRSLSPMHLSAWLYRNEAEVFFRADLKGEYEYSCSRCLAPTKESLHVEMSGMFRPRADGEFDEPEDPSVFLYANEEVDFSPVIRESIVLQLPLNPVCKEDCAGLCADCGANLNETTCQCEEEKIDPRWEALRAIRDASKSS